MLFAVLECAWTDDHEGQLEVVAACGGSRYFACTVEAGATTIVLKTATLQEGVGTVFTLVGVVVVFQYECSCSYVAHARTQRFPNVVDILAMELAAQMEPRPITSLRTTTMQTCVSSPVSPHIASSIPSRWLHSNMRDSLVCICSGHGIT